MKNIDNFKDRLVYHVSDADLDGISARILAEYFIQPIAKCYIPYNTYDRSLPDFDWKLAEEADYIIFTDLNPPVEMYTTLIEKKYEILIFDHHMTSRDILPETNFFYWDEERCGTKIFYDYLRKGLRVKPILQQYVDLVDTYDRFLTEDSLWSKAKSLHNVLFEYIDWSKSWLTDTEKHRNFILNTLYKFNQLNNFCFTKTEEAYIQNANNKELKNYKQAQKSLQLRTDNEGNNYAYIECMSKLSFIAHRLLGELDKKIEYLVAHSTFKVDGEEGLKVSIRSRNGYDCAKLAEKWEGGGHQGAAGMEFQDLNEFRKFQLGLIHLI
jgi:oligoribonuclease NrnB/cAMP/cGMP phosphodiesterase (DHH superfamily)